MVRVIIERRVKPGKEREMWSILHDLRSQGMHQPGYVSGETLVGYDNPSLWVVISTWLRAENWQAWQKSPERRAAASAEAELVTAPTKSTMLRFLEEPKRSDDDEQAAGE